MHLHIGVDDTDSLSGGCTTYICALIVEQLSRLSDVEFVDYPNLVRLNPNVPWKTRGNGAVCLRVNVAENDLEKIEELTLEKVEQESKFEDPGTNPGVVFYSGEISAELKDFSNRAVQDIVTLREAVKIIKKIKAEAFGYKSGRGIIGALAAIGQNLSGDHTYEIVAYRSRANYGTARQVDVESVRKMDELTSPLTFNNIDFETGRMLITPRGLDPILFGVRGETPEAVKRAFQMVKVNEEIERWVIFRCNHGTDAHLKRVNSISEIKPYRPIIVTGLVSSKPKTMIGGHVIFELKDATGRINCAAYEPTGGFRNIVRNLAVGDLIEVCGGVRRASKKYSRVVNLEKIRILKLADVYLYENPLCPSCRSRMESSGRGQGFRCRKCHAHLRDAEKVPVKIERHVKEGLYIPPPRAHRHLTKPLSRYGREKIGVQVNLIEEWHNP
jgi:tRNA(Ile2)-agmatinylcytidine synthase